ncbi:hypothetical protein A4A49_01669 [Nicotiana attenuata]|uniref:Uncharacterized protein n=1 Tax=Nicotiana attenuata TaxID=49451 RepID=A0A314L513_NICAT|nr:hypothetical protein A4A49_01669 [Nicotiana attenuata]
MLFAQKMREEEEGQVRPFERESNAISFWSVLFGKNFFSFFLGCSSVLNNEEEEEAGRVMSLMLWGAHLC